MHPGEAQKMGGLWRPGHATVSSRCAVLRTARPSHHPSLPSESRLSLQWTLLPDRLYIVSFSELKVLFSSIYGPALPFREALTTFSLLCLIQLRVQHWMHSCSMCGPTRTFLLNRMLIRLRVTFLSQIQVSILKGWGSDPSGLSSYPFPWHMKVLAASPSLPDDTQVHM